MIDVIIASDIRIYCQGLEQVLATAQPINVVATADRSDVALAKMSANPPEVVILDMTMANSCQLARAIPGIDPDIKIVALAVSYDESNIYRCAEAGITCYVPREASIEQLIEAITEAARGECYCPPKIAACLLKQFNRISTAATAKYRTPAAEQDQQKSHPDGGRPARLTRREQQIAGLLAEGLSNKQIARKLSIEVSTVKNHVHNILVKLEVSSRSQAVYALQQGAIVDKTPPFGLDPLVEIIS